MSDLFLRVLELVLTSSLIILMMSGLFAIKGLNLSPKLRYGLWLLTLIAIIIPYRPRFGQGLVHIEQELPAVATTTPQTAKTVAETASASSPAFSLANLPWQEILLGIWLLGVAISLGRQIYAYYHFRKLIKRWGKPITEPRFGQILFELQDLLGITDEVTLVHYPLATSPMMTGFRQPTILLPSLDYTDEELELVLEHELTHYKHRDMYANLLTILVGSLYWFNPLVAFAIRESQDAGEAYCDADVLTYRDQDYRSFYGETIISMIERSQKSPIALTTCFYSNKHKLKRRILAIMNQPVPRRGVTLLVSAAVVSLLVFSGNMITFSLTRQTAPLVTTEVFDDKAALTLALADAKLSSNQISDSSITQDKGSYLVSFTSGDVTYRYAISKKDKQITLREKNTVTVKEVTVSTTAATDPQTETSSVPAIENAIVSGFGTSNASSQNNDSSSQSQYTPATPTPSAPATPSSVRSDDDDDDRDDDKDDDDDD